MTQRLSDCFPMIQSCEEILNQINAQQKLKKIYEGWKEEEIQLSGYSPGLYYCPF